MKSKLFQIYIRVSHRNKYILLGNDAILLGNEAMLFVHNAELTFFPRIITYPLVYTASQ